MHELAEETNIFAILVPLWICGRVAAEPPARERKEARCGAAIHSWLAGARRHYLHRCRGSLQPCRGTWDGPCGVRRPSKEGLRVVPSLAQSRTRSNDLLDATTGTATNDQPP